MNVILYDSENARGNLLPISYTRPVAGIRLGIDTIADKWRAALPCADYSFMTDHYLSAKYPCGPIADDTLIIAGNLVPDERLVASIQALEPGDSLYLGDRMLARRGTEELRPKIYIGDVTSVDHLWDIFMLNDMAIRADFSRLTAGLTSRKPSPTVTVIGDESQLFIHPDAADVEGCVINVKTGPVYIGPGAEVMEGACLRGPIAVCEHAVVKMGAKIYGATTVGPYCKVGGELANVVMMAYSNKAHDGFLGNAVIGEWCNIGGGCVASNLKNDYTEIKLWNYPAHRFLKTGLQFCGLIMGDHSKAGVNTMLNTATVLGVGVNIHGSGFPRPFLASFSEGSTAGFSDVPMNKFFDTARKMMARRGVELTDTDIEILNHIRVLAEQYR
ncbi:MAG: putative sugar nucleotidyl transferase [Muribaculaceae bacterium]|nr:putative sugar nucleotidyl transferase [Muribaculaceae bacterium]